MPTDYPSAENMATTLSDDLVQPVTGELARANGAFNAIFPGEGGSRQAVHTVFGGAQIFKSTTAPKMGVTALKHMETYAPDFATFARIFDLPGSQSLPTDKSAVAFLANDIESSPDSQNDSTRLAYTVYKRVLEKLANEPVEDFRIDFEDGYGNRPDDEEDADAQAAAEQVAIGMKAGTLPAFIGIRIKPFTEELRVRSMRTLDIFLSTLAAATGGKLPDNFIVMLPKVTIPEQIRALADLFEIFEEKTAIATGALKLEFMVETPQSLLSNGGDFALPLLAAASKGRCIGVSFGVYDFTASNNITAAYQAMDHPACDFARQMMMTAFAGTSIRLSDGATNIMPLPPHRAPEGKELTPEQSRDNVETVHSAWKLGFDHINHSLRNGFYQGWDLHPAQLPVRYAALNNFFLQSWTDASTRLHSFLNKAAQASLSGNVFDDAATGQALLNYFLRGLSCGAITEAEIEAAGLSMEDIRTRSFKAIIDRHAE